MKKPVTLPSNPKKRPDPYSKPVKSSTSRRVDIYKRPKDVSKRIQNYWKEIDESGDIPTIPGLCARLGVGRQNLLTWIERAPGNERSNDPEHRCAWLIRNAVYKIEDQATQGLLGNHKGRAKGNVVGYIFYLKNNHNWLDNKTQVDHKGNITVTPKFYSPQVVDRKLEKGIQPKILDGNDDNPVPKNMFDWDEIKDKTKPKDKDEES